MREPDTLQWDLISEGSHLEKSWFSGLLRRVVKWLETDVSDAVLPPSTEKCNFSNNLTIRCNNLEHYNIYFPTWKPRHMHPEYL